MSGNQLLLHQVESCIQRRRMLMVITALAYFIWIGADALTHIPALADQQHFVTLTKIMAGAVWVIGLVMSLRLSYRIYRDKSLRGMANDERTQALGKSGLQAGYWVLLILVAGCYAASYLYTIDARVVLPLLLAIGVAVPPLTYALLEQA
jgi:hypothetical protein